MCYNKIIMQWELITNIILITSIITLAVFALLGLYQWISRKSIKKVDRQLLWMPVPLILMVITYLLFQYVFILSTRPNGSGEPSFPSTHVMVVATIFFIAMMILPKYVKSKPMRIILDILMIVMISLTSVGRVAADMHWVLDVVGAVVFAFIFTEIYYLIIHRKKKKNAKRIH